MSRQAAAPNDPPGVRSAPPKPPVWRHLLWPLGIALFLALYAVIPAVHGPKQVALSYSRLMRDVSDHTVKTIDLQPDGTATGTMTGGATFTTVLPAETGESFLDQM